MFIKSKLVVNSSLTSCRNQDCSTLHHQGAHNVPQEQDTQQNQKYAWQTILVFLCPFLFYFIFFFKMLCKIQFIF